MFNLLKTITFSLILSAPTSAFATPQVEKYVEECRIGSNLIVSTCDVFDTRTPSGFLDTRMIKPRTSNWVFKQKYVKGTGFISCDNVSGRCYKYDYRPTKHGSQVAPWLIIKNVSWD